MDHQTLNIFLAAAAVIVLATGMYSSVIKRYCSPPLISLAAGILLGPALLDALKIMPAIDSHMLIEQFCRLTLAIGLMGIALRLRPYRLKNIFKPGMIIIAIAMPMMWLLSSLMTYYILPGTALTAILVGAVITPTDPIVAGSIVSGKHARRNIRKQIRDILSFESGANDGLAYLFVFLPLLLMKFPAGEAIPDWLLRVFLWEILAATAAGILIGFFAGVLFQRAMSKETVERTTVFTFSVGLAVFILAATKLIQTDGILAVFAGGLVFNFKIQKQIAEKEGQFEEAENLLFTLPAFMLFGIMIPWEKYLEMGWLAIAFPVLVLLFRRLPVFILLKFIISKFENFGDAILLGWFGPIGISAIFYAALAFRISGNEQVWTFGSLVILASVAAHGLTAGPLTKLYGKKQNDHEM